MNPPNKRTKFSPSNVQEQELIFMRMHNVAMGYEAREVNEASSSNDIVRLANAQFPVPSHIHSSFQDMLRIQRQARFDCFQEPSLACECYNTLDSRQQRIGLFRKRVCTEDRHGVERT